MQVFHVVGTQGVGKSTLILALAAQHEARGRVCAGQDPDVFTSLKEALAEKPGADVYFIEHLRMDTAKAGPRDFVIQMEQMPATNDPQASQPAEQGAV